LARKQAGIGGDGRAVESRLRGAIPRAIVNHGDKRADGHRAGRR
jgi:hypothetical protein